MVFITVGLGDTTAFCAFKWLSYYISCTALFWYLEQKNIPFPSEEEMKRGYDWATEHIIRDLFCFKH